MTADKYAMDKLFLSFRDKSMESSYRNFILDRTLFFARIAWGLVISIGGAFALLDRPVFGDNADLVLTMRGIVLSIAALALATTFIPRWRAYLDWSAFVFILSVSLFCIFLTAVSDSKQFALYFAGFIFAYTGVFTIPGLGFRYSVFAFLASLIAFEIVFAWVAPIAPTLLFTYNFFLIGMIVIFIYLGFLVEQMSRKNYVFSTRLRDSLSKVQKLSGLLPICAHCKKIRDDTGYWQQVEIYIADHSEAEFSHGLCPGCGEALYSGQEWYNGPKADSGDGNR